MTQSSISRSRSESQASAEGLRVHSLSPAVANSFRSMSVTVYDSHAEMLADDVVVEYSLSGRTARTLKHDADSPNSTRNTSEAWLKNLANLYLKAGACQRREIRALIGERVESAPDISSAISAILEACLASKRAGRLQDAIDLLNASNLSSMSIMPLLLPEKQTNDALSSDRDFVLIQVAAQCNDLWSDALLYHAMTGGTDAACEGAIEQLSHRNGDWTREILEWAANNRSSAILRELARECLNEFDDEGTSDGA